MTSRRLPAERLMKPDEVAAMFRVGVPTVSRWRRAGKLTGIPAPGGRYLYLESAVRSAYESDHPDPKGSTHDG